MPSESVLVNPLTFGAVSFNNLHRFIEFNMSRHQCNHLSNIGFFSQVSLRRVVCSLWFAVIDLYFREISVGGAHKLESLKDGRSVSSIIS